MSTEHVGGQRDVSRGAAGAQIIIDMTPSRCSGFGPLDAALAALDACSRSDVVNILEKRRTPGSKSRVELSGFRDPEASPPRDYRYDVGHAVQGGWRNGPSRPVRFRVDI